MSDIGQDMGKMFFVFLWDGDKQELDKFVLDINRIHTNNELKTEIGLNKINYRDLTI